MSSLSQLQVDLRQMIIAIETAVSQVGMNDTNHGKRVGYIASQIGHQLNFSDGEIQYAFELGLLHDCGVSTEQMHTNLVNHFDWNNADIHCKVGYRLLKDFEPLSKFATPILYHHTPSLAKRNEKHVGIVHIADYITAKNIYSPIDKESGYPLDQSSLDILSISDNDLKDIEQSLCKINTPHNEEGITLAVNDLI